MSRIYWPAYSNIFSRVSIQNSDVVISSVPFLAPQGKRYLFPPDHPMRKRNLGQLFIKKAELILPPTQNQHSLYIAAFHPHLKSGFLLLLAGRCPHNHSRLFEYSEEFVYSLRPAFSCFFFAASFGHISYNEMCA